jgi:hypothetical protein
VKSVDVQLNRLAAGHYSLAKRQKAINLGMTARQLDERVASGLLVPVHRGVYRLAGAPMSSEQALLATPRRPTSCWLMDGGCCASPSST